MPAIWWEHFHTLALVVFCFGAQFNFHDAQFINFSFFCLYFYCHIQEMLLNLSHEDLPVFLQETLTLNSRSK